MSALPKNWRTVALGDVVDLASGQVDPREEPYSQMPHVGGDNIESGTGTLFGMRTPSELGLISGKYLFDDRDILYSKIRPYLNKVATPAFSGLCSADIYPLRPKEGVATKEFVARLLRTQDFLNFAETCSSRTSIPKINRDSLLRYQCNLPPLAEQKRIAAILDKADAIRRKRQEAIKLTEELLRSAFLEMFGDPVTNPKGWATETIGGVAGRFKGAVQTGPFGSQLHASDYTTQGTPVVMPQDLVAGGISDEYVARVTDDHVGRLERHILCVGDVVFSRRGDVARFAVVGEREAGWLCGTGCLRVRFGEARLLPSFVRGELSHESKRRWLESEAKGTTMLNLNTTILSGLPIRLPPIELQKQFERISEVIDTTRRQTQGYWAVASALLESATACAFAGRL